MNIGNDTYSMCQYIKFMHWHRISIPEHLTELMNKSQSFTYNVTILLLMVKKTLMLKIVKAQSTKKDFMLFKCKILYVMHKNIATKYKERCVA